MAIDTPARIAIIGAGPIGIEAGLYGRYLGYDVVILERDCIAAHVLRWRHMRMFSPFSQLCSPLGLAALRAQDPDYTPPQPTSLLTGQQWVDQYLWPLSQTDLLADHIVCGVTVLGVGRNHFLKPEADEGQRGADGFRLLLEHRNGSQSIETADIVIDATGVFGTPNWCGAGGLPARGERQLRSRIEYSIPDVLGSARADYEARRVLLVGHGLTAAATIVTLAKLVERVPQTDVTWVTPPTRDEPSGGPIFLGRDDELPHRRRLTEEANQLAQANHPRIHHRSGVLVEAIDYDAADRQFVVTFNTSPQSERFDRIIANVGYHPDRSLYEELQVDECPRTGGLAGLRSQSEVPASCIDRVSEQPAEHLKTSEPNFYILGAKSYGRDASFQMADGFHQIRDLFALIGGRATLDLYATAEKLQC